MPVLSLGYLRLESTDLEAWKTFAGDFLGLMPVAAEGEESLRYRMDHYPPRLVVSPGEENRAAAIGFEVLNARDLKRTVAAVEDAGIKVIEGTVAECDERRVTGFVRFDDPGGNPIELFYGPILDHKPVVLPTVSSFVTTSGPQGATYLECWDEPLSLIETTWHDDGHWKRRESASKTFPQP